MTYTQDVLERMADLRLHGWAMAVDLILRALRMWLFRR